MSRYIVTFALLGAVILWLVLSYAPFPLPSLAFGTEVALAWFPALALILLGIFALIQVDLVRATVRMLQQPVDGALREVVQEFGLRTAREVLWTALPLVGTVFLAMLLIAM